MNEENIEHKVEVTFTTDETTNEYLKNKIIPIIYMKEENLDIKDGRTYYYNILGTAVDKCDNQYCAGLFININDYFAPAADSEPVTYDELPKLYELYKEKKYDGVSQFVADKRGIPNIYWKDEGSDYNKRVKENA